MSGEHEKSVRRAEPDDGLEGGTAYAPKADTVGEGLRRIAVEPASSRLDVLSRAVIDGGGTIVPVEEAAALVWADPGSPELLPGIVDRPERRLLVTSVTRKTALTGRINSPQAGRII